MGTGDTHSAGLGGREAMRVKPLFQIGFCKELDYQHTLAFFIKR